MGGWVQDQPGKARVGPGKARIGQGKTGFRSQFGSRLFRLEPGFPQARRVLWAPPWWARRVFASLPFLFRRAMGWRQRSAGWEYGRQRAWGSGGSSSVRSRDWWCSCGWGNPNHHRYCGKCNTPWWVKSTNSSNKVERPQRWAQGPPAWLQNLRGNQEGTPGGGLADLSFDAKPGEGNGPEDPGQRAPEQSDNHEEGAAHPADGGPSQAPFIKVMLGAIQGMEGAGLISKLLTDMLAQCEDHPQTLTPEEAAKQLRSLLDRREDRMRKKVANEQTLEYHRAKCQEAGETNSRNWRRNWWSSNGTWTV